VNFSQADLEQLIVCSKRVTDPPRTEMKVENGYTRNDFRLESLDSAHQFQAFFRRNERFPENFSLGLIYLPSDAVRFPLVRVNGPHGDFNCSFDPSHPHSDTHVHRMSAEDLAAGIMKPRLVAVSREYASFEQAIPYFLNLVKVMDAGLYFDRYLQLELPLGGPEVSS
jgi:hypothetical protein